MTRAAARRNAERLTALQQAKQLSRGPSTSRDKDPEPNPTPPKSPDQLRLDRFEIMMERMLESMQILAESRSRRPSRSSRHSSRHPCANLPRFPRRRTSLARTLRSPVSLTKVKFRTGSTMGPINCPISFDQLRGSDQHGRTRSVAGRCSCKVQSRPSRPRQHSGRWTSVPDTSIIEAA
jgi:hypothetical protein